MNNSMTPQRAIEILNPEHREHYGSIETVNEACRMGMESLKKQMPKKPEPDCYSGKYLCPACHQEESYSVDGLGNYCSKCGQALDWSDER